MRVGDVDGLLLDEVDEGLVEEKLPDVGDGATGNSVVGEQSSVEVSQDVDVSSTAGVYALLEMHQQHRLRKKRQLTVTGEQGLESDDTVIVGLLNTTEGSVVDVAQIGSVTVSAGNDATVDTSGVAVPHLRVSLRDGLAGVDIDDLDVERQRNTGLALDNVLTNELARHPVRAFGRLGSEDAASISSEQESRVSSLRSDGEVGVVVGGENVLERASLEQGLVWEV